MDIKINNKNTKHGFVKGEIGQYKWFALVQKNEVDYGINPKTLNRGKGKVVRLCIYKDIFGNTDNKDYRRLIFANYHREWEVLSDCHREVIKRLVEYLERRYSIRLIK